MFTKPQTNVSSDYPNQFGRLVDIVEGPARRNFIRNGDFQIAQRGTSFAGIVAEQYTLDGWKAGHAGTSTVTQEAFTVGQTDVPHNPTNFMRVARTVAAGADNIVAEQRIEFPARLSGKTVTVGFYAKVAAGTKALVFDLGSSGVTSAINTADNAFTPSTAWAPFTAQIVVPTITSATASAYVNLRIREAAGFGTFTLDIADVQVEEGLEATRFERLEYFEQWLWAQRFLPGLSGVTATSDQVGLGFGRSATQAYIQHPFPTIPRVKPTGLSVSNGAHFAVADGAGATTVTTAVAFAAASMRIATIDVTVAAGLTQHRPYLMNTGGSAAAYLLFTGAEL